MKEKEKKKKVVKAHETSLIVSTGKCNLYEKIIITLSMIESLKFVNKCEAKTYLREKNIRKEFKFNRVFICDVSSIFWPDLFGCNCWLCEVQM